jgi:hypothetical protein
MTQEKVEPVDELDGFRPLVVWSLILNSSVSACLAYLVVYKLGDVPEGTVVDLISLLLQIVTIGGLAFLLSLALSIGPLGAQPRLRAAYGVMLLTALPGLLPFLTSLCLVHFLIWFRSLVVADLH